MSETRPESDAAGDPARGAADSAGIEPGPDGAHAGSAPAGDGRVGDAPIGGATAAERPAGGEPAGSSPAEDPQADGSRAGDAPAGDHHAGLPPAAGQELEQLKNLLLFLPRLAVLVGKLLVDPEVSRTDKLLLGAVVVYIASPLDFIPDFVPVLGQLDDIYLVALCLMRLLNRSGEAKLRAHWDGPEDIVHVLYTVSDYATRYLPRPVRTAVRNWVDVRDSEPPAAS